MAKNSTAVATPTLADLKAQKEALDAQLKALKEQEKAAASAAKQEAEAKAKESEEACNAAIDVLSSALLDAIGDCQPLEVIRVVNATSLIALIEAREGGDASSLKEAIEALEQLGGLKGPKASRNGTGEAKSFAASGELTAMQRRIILHLNTTGQPASRQALTEVANGKEKLASGRAVTMDGNQLGQRDPAKRHPLSLLGRGFIEEFEVKDESGTKNMFKITKDGKAAAKAIEKAAK